MFGRFAKRVGETALEGAAQGVGLSVGEELKGVVYQVDRIADKVETMVSGEDLKRVESKVNEVHDMVRVLYEKFGLDPESGPEPRKRDEID